MRGPFILDCHSPGFLPNPCLQRFFQILFLLLVLLPSISCRSHGRDPSTLVVLLESSPVNLDPRIGTDAFSERLDQLLFSSLFRRDERAQLVPDLVSHWESPDPRTYLFHLRHDAFFHDGRPVNAADVRYTFESIREGSVKTVKRQQYAILSQIETPDEFTVIMKLREPNAGFLWNLSLGKIGIVPHGAPADFAQHPIGSGPFQFVSMKQDEHVIVARNPHYYDSPARVERVLFKVVPEAIVRALEMRKGAADIALNALTPDIVRALGSDSKLRVIQEPGTTYKYLAFNLEDPILKSLKVRQAIASALDIPALIRYLWQGQGRPASGIIPPSVWAYEPNVTHYPHNLSRARALLDEAGYPAPGPEERQARFTLTYKTSTEELSRLEAAVIQQQLKEVGIRVEVRSDEFATFYSDIVQGNFQMYSLRWIGDNLNPDIFDGVFYSRNLPPGGKNRGHYSNPRVDRLIQIARVEPDRGLRGKYYSEIQKILAEDLPYVSLWYIDNVCVANRRVKNIHLFPSGEFDFLKQVTLENND